MTDLISLAPLIPSASMISNGQTCFTCTRVLAPQSRYKHVKHVLDFTAVEVSSFPVDNLLERTHSDRADGLESLSRALQGLDHESKSEVRNTSNAGDLNNSTEQVAKPRNCSCWC